MRKTRRLRKKRGVKTNSNKKYYKQKRKRSYKRNSLKKQKKTRRKRTTGGSSALKNFHDKIRSNNEINVSLTNYEDLSTQEPMFNKDALWLAINYGNVNAVKQLLQARVPVYPYHLRIAEISKNTPDFNRHTVSEITSNQIYNLILNANKVEWPNFQGPRNAKPTD